MKQMISLAVVVLLAACSAGDDGQKVAASSALPDTEVQTAASESVVEMPKSEAASDIAASAAEQKTAEQTLSELNQAKWQSYRCEEGKIEVRYYQSSAGVAAQVKFQGTTFTAPYSPELSNEDLTAFSNGNETWTIGKEFGQDYYREANGFLVRHEQFDSAEGEQIVDNLLVQECTPESK
ncbi:hypothetical protein [Neisseria animalis]|nr:hypothetical protein [Neisseria animalis]